MANIKPSIDSVSGFQVAGVHAGLKAGAQLDMSIFVSTTDCTAAAVFTTNTVKAAPVLLGMERITANPTSIRAVAVNTKSANACTGDQGLTNAHEMSRLVAEAVGCTPEQTIVMSTGVIGTQLPMPKIADGIRLSASALGHDWDAAARGMMTTDTRPKLASALVTLSNGQTVQIAGVSKGSGMIAPNMATMLGVIVTDAALSPAEAQEMLAVANDLTFNRIVVDGDMSTNDTVVLLANGASGQSLITPHDREHFQEALTAVSRKLAQDIVRDGEGMTRFVTLHVQNAASGTAARQIANTIATSPLVKTAFFGADANWGRIVAAAGRAGVPFDPSSANLFIQPGEATIIAGNAVKLFERGVPTRYAEAAATAVMQQTSITVILDCGAGDGAATVWTCDLSYDYIKINGDYRT